MSPNEKISHIEPKKKWLDVDLRGLGPLWYVIQPLLTTIMYMFVFGGLAGISTDSIPQPLFYMAGITMWNYFSSCFTACSDVFSRNASVFGKVYFPRLVVPLSSCTSNLIRMLIQLLMFIIIYIYYVATGLFTVSISFSVLFFPLLILMTGLHAMSWGLLFSSWTTKYRDLKFLIGFGVQLLMYATPVIYPLSFAPERYRYILELNPLTPIFEAFKYSCLGTGTFSISGLIFSLLFLVTTMFFSVIIFNRTEQRFMDTV